MTDTFQLARQMSPREYERTIAALGMTRVAAGRYLGVSERTARRYCSGDRDVPPPIVMLLRLLVALNIDPIVPKPGAPAS